MEDNEIVIFRSSIADGALKSVNSPIIRNKPYIISKIERRKTRNVDKFDTPKTPAIAFLRISTENIRYRKSLENQKHKLESQ